MRKWTKKRKVCFWSKEGEKVFPLLFIWNIDMLIRKTGWLGSSFCDQNPMKMPWKWIICLLTSQMYKSLWKTWPTCLSQDSATEIPFGKLKNILLTIKVVDFIELNLPATNRHATCDFYHFSFVFMQVEWRECKKREFSWKFNQLERFCSVHFNDADDHHCIMEFTFNVQKNLMFDVQMQILKHFSSLTSDKLICIFDFVIACAFKSLTKLIEQIIWVD